ncbi:MAG: hypothetical protein IKL97_07495 [Eggerthellaceae bacterium]|nr:hypothetical protein [Eggerthellaceae bacterium]
MALSEEASFATSAIPVKLGACPDVDETLRYLGYAGQAIDAHLLSRMDVAVSLCGQFRPAGAFCVLDISENSGEEIVCAPSGNLSLPSVSLAQHVAGACAIVLMAVTLGLESERVIRRELALSPTDGMLVNAAASSMAEASADALQREVSKWAEERGLRVGPRFSPGYGDLALDVQPLLLERLNATRLLGMNVTEARLLVPSKSITAVAGLYKREDEYGDLPVEKRARAMTCEECGMAQACLLRQQGRTCHGSRS